MLWSLFWWPSPADAQEVGRSGGGERATSPIFLVPAAKPPFALAQMPGEGPAVEEDGAEQTPALTLAEIAELQRLLKRLGFEPGGADGIVGPATRAEIRKFQASAGLEADGVPTPALLAQLRDFDRMSTNAGGGTALPAAERSRVASAGGPARRDTAGLGAVEGVALRGGLPKRALQVILAKDFFAAKSIEEPWRVAGDGFEPHWRLGMRAGEEAHGLTRAFREAWLAAAATLGLSRPARRSAELYADLEFRGPFLLTVGFRTGGSGGRLLIGPYLGPSRRDGYRIVYSPGEGHRMALLWQRDGRRSIIARRDAPVKLRRGILHELSWSRSLERRLRIAVDGREIFAVADPHPEAAFDGVTIVARNGAFSIGRIELRGIRADAARVER